LVGGAGAIIVADLGIARGAVSRRAMIADRTAVVIRTVVLIVICEDATFLRIARVVGARIAVVTSDGRSNTSPCITMVVIGTGIVVAAGVFIVRGVGAFACV